MDLYQQGDLVHVPGDPMTPKKTKRHETIGVYLTSITDDLCVVLVRPMGGKTKARIVSTADLSRHYLVLDETNDGEYPIYEWHTLAADLTPSRIAGRVLGIGTGQEWVAGHETEGYDSYDHAVRVMGLSYMAAGVQ